MAEVISNARSTAPPPPGEGLPEVCLEVGAGTARSTLYIVAEAGFLIGTVPGCDLRVPGLDWPAVLCLIARRPGGASLRKLAPTLPLQVNGNALASAELVHGDRVKIGNIDMTVQVRQGAQAPVKAAPSTAALDVARHQLQQQMQQFREQVVRFEQERRQFAEEAQQQRQELETLRAQEPPKPLPAELPTAQQQEELMVQRQELATQRQELADIRTQLYDRYRERRDRLAGLQESVNKAARKVQERKQQLEAELRATEHHRREEASRRAELEAQAANVQQARQLFEEERKLHEVRVVELRQELTDRLAACNEHQQQLAADRAALEKDQARYRDDLVRLDRLQATHDERERQLAGRQRELDQRLEQLHSDTRVLEEQAGQLDEWHTKLSAVGEKLAKQKTEQETASQQLAQRAAALEGQQAALAALRTRMERIREDVRQQEQALSEQRARQETTEADLLQKQQEAQRLRDQVEDDRTLLDQERRMLADRAAVLEGAVNQLRQAQEKMAVDEQRVREKTQALDAASAEQAEAGSLLQARITQYEELHRRLEAERDALRERALLLTQAEQARETLQEQLRRRSEELGQRQKALHELQAQQQAAVKEIDTRRADLERASQELHGSLDGERQQLAQRTQALAEQEAALAARSEALERERQEFAAGTRQLEEESREFSLARAKFDAQRIAAEEASQRSRADLEALRREALALQQQLPELELRAGTALERLTHAREQMREHLDEVHSYAGQCRDELDALRNQVQGEADRMQQQEQSLRRSQDEQRLAMAAFRQQLIDWQGQIADLKRLMAHDETRLGQQEARVAEQARQLDADTMRLAQQAEQLLEQERVVAEKRSEMDRHLGDMREWYRRKLRELAGIREHDDVGPPAEIDPAAPKRDILSLTGDVDPIDRKLGELMRALELVEADTLTALLVEARRQRRSLRQVLLASGSVTLYQMALIEAGNLDGLMLGPVRVIDRLRMLPRETVYRVFDPRRGSEAVLRHLAEAEAEDAARPDEFRQRFTQALLAHPNIAATLEVLEIAGRPAVLQEWLSGLPSTEWPALAAVPGVWYRLLLQAAQALAAAHETGLVHGHLEPQHMLLTSDGVLKVAGFGEPPWLTTASFADDAAADLQTLGRLASDWCTIATKTKGARPKPLPQALLGILLRLADDDAELRPASAAALLDELEQIAAAVPANPEAWDRLVKHVKDNATPLAALRQSA